MNKFYGSIGFAESYEKSPGVWEEKIIERKYYGNVIKKYYKYEEKENVNEDLNVNNQISIIIDPYAIKNFSRIRYVVWLGTRWRINTVEVSHPRLILSIGGIYNGPEPESNGTSEGETSEGT